MDRYMYFSFNLPVISQVTDQQHSMNNANENNAGQQKYRNLKDLRWSLSYYKCPHQQHL